MPRTRTLGEPLSIRLGVAQDDSLRFVARQTGRTPAALLRMFVADIMHRDPDLLPLWAAHTLGQDESPPDTAPEPERASGEATGPDPAQCGAIHDGWLCTRRPMHPGDHIARDSEGVACGRWPRSRQQEASAAYLRGVIARGECDCQGTIHAECEPPEPVAPEGVRCACGEVALSGPLAGPVWANGLAHGHLRCEHLPARAHVTRAGRCQCGQVEMGSGTTWSGHGVHFADRPCQRNGYADFTERDRIVGRIADTLDVPRELLATPYDGHTQTDWREFARRIVDQTERAAPVDTGQLRASMATVPTDLPDLGVVDDPEDF